MTPDECRDFLAELQALAVDDPSLLGWEPVSAALRPSHDQEVIDLVRHFQSLRTTPRTFCLVQDRRGRLLIFERIERIHRWWHGAAS